MSRPAPAFLPLLLSEASAAHYLGISPRMLRDLPLRRRTLGARRLYDRRDLDAFADALPYEAGEEEVDTCDGRFGVRP